MQGQGKSASKFDGWTFTRISDMAFVGTMPGNGSVTDRTIANGRDSLTLEENAFLDQYVRNHPEVAPPTSVLNPLFKGTNDNSYVTLSNGAAVPKGSQWDTVTPKSATTTKASTSSIPLNNSGYGDYIIAGNEPILKMNSASDYGILNHKQYDAAIIGKGTKVGHMSGDAMEADPNRYISAYDASQTLINGAYYDRQTHTLFYYGDYGRMANAQTFGDVYRTGLISGKTGNEDLVKSASLSYYNSLGISIPNQSQQTGQASTSTSFSGSSMPLIYAPSKPDLSQINNPYSYSTMPVDTSAFANFIWQQTGVNYTPTTDKEKAEFTRAANAFNSVNDYNSRVTSVNAAGTVFGLEVSAFNKASADYETKVVNHNNRIADFNNQVAFFQQDGVITQDEYNQLLPAFNSLNDESNTLDRQRSSLLERYGKLRNEGNSLNSQIGQLQAPNIDMANATLSGFVSGYVAPAQTKVNDPYSQLFAANNVDTSPYTENFYNTMLKTGADWYEQNIVNPVMAGGYLNDPTVRASPKGNEWVNQSLGKGYPVAAMNADPDYQKYRAANWWFEDGLSLPSNTARFVGAGVQAITNFGVTVATAPGALPALTLGTAAIVADDVISSAKANPLRFGYNIGIGIAAGSVSGAAKNAAKSGVAKAATSDKLAPVIDTAKAGVGKAGDFAGVKLAPVIDSVKKFPLSENGLTVGDVIAKPKTVTPVDHVGITPDISAEYKPTFFKGNNEPGYALTVEKPVNNPMTSTTQPTVNTITAPSLDTPVAVSYKWVSNSGLKEGNYGGVVTDAKPMTRGQFIRNYGSMGVPDYSFSPSVTNFFKPHGAGAAGRHTEIIDLSSRSAAADAAYSPLKASVTDTYLSTRSGLNRVLSTSSDGVSGGRSRGWTRPEIDWGNIKTGELPEIRTSSRSKTATRDEPLVSKPSPRTVVRTRNITTAIGLAAASTGTVRQVKTSSLSVEMPGISSLTGVGTRSISKPTPTVKPASLSLVNVDTIISPSVRSQSLSRPAIGSIATTHTKTSTQKTADSRSWFVSPSRPYTGGGSRDRFGGKWGLFQNAIGDNPLGMSKKQSKSVGMSIGGIGFGLGGSGSKSKSKKSKKGRR